MTRSIHACCWLFLAPAWLAWGAPSGPSVEQALKLTPMQADVEYDVPPPDEIAACTIRPETMEGQSAWVVCDRGERLLRRFVDTNQDNKVDQWCYAKEGVEVYRDIDSNFDGKADQYRWLGSQGTRWGIDQDQDGRVDQWRAISAEELSAEFVAALCERDFERFSVLVISPEELEALKLGQGLEQRLRQQAEKAKQDFPSLARNSRLVKDKTRWVDFAALRPGVIPASAGGPENDLWVYENVAAVVETDGKPDQVLVGTLVKLSDAWRLVSVADEKVAAAAHGIFFPASHAVAASDADPHEIDPRIEEQIEKLDQLNTSLRTATPDEISRLHIQRSEILSQLARTATGEDRILWQTELIDSIHAAVQAGFYPQGADRLETLVQQLREEKADSQVLAHAQFAAIQSRYAISQTETADFAKIQEKWLADLSQYVKEFPKAADTAEATLHLAIAYEFSGQEQLALDWYSRITEQFPKLAIAKKAAGARARIQSVGKSIPVSGTTLDGRPFNLAQLRGRVVLIHYWATWCQPCKQEMEVIKGLLQRLANRKFVVVGVNVDNDRTVAQRYVQTQRITWPQLFDGGGLDGRLATEMGIFALPVMILIDANGKVAHRAITIGELESELAKRL